jgi:hypothetical protein
VVATEGAERPVAGVLEPGAEPAGAGALPPVLGSSATDGADGRLGLGAGTVGAGAVGAGAGAGAWGGGAGSGAGSAGAGAGSAGTGTEGTGRLGS